MSIEKRIYKVAIYEMRIDQKPGQADRRIQNHTQYEQIFSDEQIDVNLIVEALNSGRFIKPIVLDRKEVPSPAELGEQ